MAPAHCSTQCARCNTKPKPCCALPFHSRRQFCNEMATLPPSGCSAQGLQQVISILLCAALYSFFHYACAVLLGQHSSSTQLLKPMICTTRLEQALIFGDSGAFQWRTSLKNWKLRNSQPSLDSHYANPTSLFVNSDSLPAFDSCTFIAFLNLHSSALSATSCQTAQLHWQCALQKILKVICLAKDTIGNLYK